MTGYWKFLAAGSASPFAGFDWTAAGSRWVEAGAGTRGGGVEECRRGFHACRIRDLPYWLNDELWSIELETPVALAHKVVASRARLGDRVEGWTPELQRQLAVACIGRSAAHAVDELRDVGLLDAAPGLAEAVATRPERLDRAVLRTAAESAAAAAADEPRTRPAHRLALFVVDAVDYLDECPVATLAYIAARAANFRSRVEVDDPVAAERAWQSAWLAERLGLPPDR
jgi:hypothetical protein